MGPLFLVVNVVSSLSCWAMVEFPTNEHDEYFNSYGFGNGKIWARVGMGPLFLVVNVVSSLSCWAMVEFFCFRR